MRISSSLSFKVRRQLDNDFLIIAERAVNESKQHHDSGDHVEELRLAAQAIVFSAFAVEATVNRHGIDKLGDEFRNWESKPFKPLKAKIRYIYDGTQSYQIADIGKKMLQDIDKLLENRNYLAHHKLTWVDPVKTEHFSMTEVANKIHHESAADSYAMAVGAIAEMEILLPKDAS